MAEDAAAVLRQRHAPERVAGDVRDAVVLGQPLVHERVVGRQQVEHAAVLADEAVEEQLGLALHRLRQRVVVLRIQQVVRDDLVEVLQAQPLRREARRQRLRPRVGQHAPHLLLEAGGRAQRAGWPRLQQLGVRRRAPQEERQARGQIVVGDAVGLRGSRIAGGACSRRNRKRGLTRIDCSAIRMPLSKPPFSRPCS